jgi:alanine-glyoxylate transaminase/serine-glyoxylate transaminase/serine-pyruvate transaminase
MAAVDESRWGVPGAVLGPHSDAKFIIGGGLNKVAGKVFRIGHLGWLNEIMVLQALGGVELAMQDVGIAFEPGCGVGAAVPHLSRAGEAMRMAAE